MRRMLRKRGGVGGPVRDEEGVGDEVQSGFLAGFADGGQVGWFVGVGAAADEVVDAVLVAGLDQQGVVVGVQDQPLSADAALSVVHRVGIAVCQAGYSRVRVAVLAGWTGGCRAGAG